MQQSASAPATSSTSRSVSAIRRRVGPILVVDDYDDARTSVREALEDAGHTVIEADNGQQALNYLVARPAERPSLIVLDLQMPVMDGWRFIELIKCYVSLANIPIIITTAQEPRLEQVTHRAVVGSLHAPYPLPKLVELVEQYVGVGSNDTRGNRT
jgi:CheY-like chemotaxis protein